MKGITFGALHSYRDLHLILTAKEIGSPEVKSMKIPIEGANGSLDLTDFFGEPKYSDVTHKFEFETIVAQSDFLTQFSQVKNAIHGKRERIILDDDPSFYYLGRCFVSSFTNEKNVGRITVECDCEPYKYKLNSTAVSRLVSGTQTFSLSNSRKRAVPTITTTASMTFTFGEYSTTRSAGTFVIPELELVEGSNDVTVTGTGSITFTWQEGGL